ncbi:MAG TPA: glycosyltransferase [Balneolaceae bacterium]|nr:glycosyltransferase [Balneolaceae bacterium]
MAESPFISVIICTYNRAEYLQDTLKSLLQTDTAVDQFEVLIIDNNSTDETPDVIQSAIADFPKIQIKHIKESKQGLSHARNRGIRESSAPILLFLDDDITVHLDFLATWVSFFRQYPQASGGGGKIHVQFDDPRPTWMSYFLLPLLGYHDLGNSIKKYPSNKYPFGGNMAFRREIFEKYGTFNTQLGRIGSGKMASEEKEFYRRLSDNEGIYYVPNAFIHHRVNKQRLTKTFIKKQALGLGKSIALQMQQASAMEKGRQISSEIIKIFATFFLSMGYAIGLQFPKAVMLFKFRGWIWQGYAMARAEQIST